MKIKFVSKNAITIVIKVGDGDYDEDVQATDILLAILSKVPESEFLELPFLIPSDRSSNNE